MPLCLQARQQFALLQKLARTFLDEVFGNGEPNKQRFPVHHRSGWFLRGGGLRCGCAQSLNVLMAPSRKSAALTVRLCASARWASSWALSANDRSSLAWPRSSFVGMPYQKSFRLPTLNESLPWRSLTKPHRSTSCQPVSRSSLAQQFGQLGLRRDPAILQIGVEINADVAPMLPNHVCAIRQRIGCKYPIANERNRERDSQHGSRKHRFHQKSSSLCPHISLGRACQKCVVGAVSSVTGAICRVYAGSTVLCES